MAASDHPSSKTSVTDHRRGDTLSSSDSTTQEGQGGGSREPVLKKTRRRLPHWELLGAAYFVTFRLNEGELVDEERQLVLDHIHSGNGRFYMLAGCVVMPDHVHMVFKPLGDHALSDIMKGIKGVSARRLNQKRGTRGALWQDESWDRIIRNEEDFESIIRYMIENPAASELCRENEAYPWLFLNQESL